MAYSTEYGRAFHGDSLQLLKSTTLRRYQGKIDLIFTSPPFPINTKKSYGNELGDSYTKWLTNYSTVLSKFLSPTGSIVIEIGNSWDKGHPTMSTTPMLSLLAFKEASNLHLCQEFIWSNPARLPSPVQWVNIKRIRVKDNFTRIWWMSPSANPKADNRRVLQPYSEAMKKLLKSQSYNSGVRPSAHDVNDSSFLTNNRGAIPGSVLNIANTGSKDLYLKHCKENGIKPHPARMPVPLAEFFIKFLTEPGDVVLDPFAGSNVTGFAAESNSRHWISIERDFDFIKGSSARFPHACSGPALK